jgi:hypothetical protein
MQPRIAICLFAGILAAGVYSGLARGQAQRTVLDGVYTAEQAKRGETAFNRANCPDCHEGGDADGPELTGDAFLDRWREDTLDSLFTTLKTKMPADAPASLSDPTYIDILAYLLQTNNFNPGAAELTQSGVQSILLVGHDGPKPLPTNTIVQTVGCLTAGPNNTWQLTGATEPVRAKPESQGEAKLAETQPLGSQTFRLLNVSDAKPAFNPDVEKGRKVMVKGALVRDSNGDRINTASLLTVAATCSQ